MLLAMSVEVCTLLPPRAWGMLLVFLQLCGSMSGFTDANVSLVGRTNTVMQSKLELVCVLHRFLALRCCLVW